MFKWLYGSILYAKADRLGTYAAALAYCFVLSMVPFLAVTFAVGMEISSELSLNKDYEEDYAAVLGDIIPMESQHDTERIFAAVQHSAQGGLVTVGFILAIYTSFNLMNQIIRTLLFIFDDPRRAHAWSWMMVIKTVALLLIWMCLLLLISISAVEAGVLRHLLDRLGFSSFSKGLAAATQVLVMVLALFGTFYLTFYLVPARRHQNRFVVEGSLLASCGWIVCSLIFASLMPKLLKASAAYIALGSIVGILLWAQACAWSVIIGACWIVRFSTRPK
ncbi:MAG: YihY/virulence factor BrkB family protein [Methylacidiphilales bacterium]|nr:YihY/virulence factor BrkB family protein [Candidatus Methylacidiphilales bacterium]